MKYQTFLASLALATTALTPIAYAQETLIAPLEPTIITDPAQIMTNELAGLKVQDADPTTGFFERFFLRLKIRELEHKLNLSQALQ